MSDTTRIYSWNVNGIRAAVRKGFLDWLPECGADIVALQEVRALPEQLTKATREPEGWRFAINPAERKGYSGVGVYARRDWDELTTELDGGVHDQEGRLQFVRFGELLVVNGYFPNGSGKNRDNSRIPWKLEFYSMLFNRLQPLLEAGEKILVVGDFNTAHEDIDLARPASNRKTSGFVQEERDELTRWLDAGWIDTFRARHPDAAECYSWWSQRRGVRERNVGWRIDYIYASPAAWEHVVEASIHPDIMGSDHCPISVDVTNSIFGE